MAIFSFSPPQVPPPLPYYQAAKTVMANKQKSAAFTALVSCHLEMEPLSAQHT